MVHDNILDASHQPVAKPSLYPYKLGIGFGTVNAVIWILSFAFLRERLPQGTNLFTGLIILSTVLGLVGMVAICFIGDSTKLFWNIFKTGFAYFELSIAMGFVATFVSTFYKAQSLPNEILLMPVYLQILIIPILIITSIIWLIPGHLVFYLQFIRDYKEKMFK